MSITVGTPRGKLRMQCGIVCICNFCRFFCNDVCKYCHVTMSKYFLSGNIARLCIEKTKLSKIIFVYLPFLDKHQSFNVHCKFSSKFCSSIYIKKVWNFAWRFAESLHQTCKHGWKFVASSSANFRSWLKVWYNPLIFLQQALKLLANKGKDRLPEKACLRAHYAPTRLAIGVYEGAYCYHFRLPGFYLKSSLSYLSFQFCIQI